MGVGGVPVSVLGRELVRGGGLDGVNPACGSVSLSAVNMEREGGERTGNGELALTLQESRVGSDELLRL